MRRLKFIGAAVLFFGALFAVSPADAQVPCPPGGGSQYPPSSVGLLLSVTVASPGQLVGVQGCGFLGTSSVSIEIRSTPRGIGSTTTDSSGNFGTTVTIPRDTTPGRHSIAAIGAGPDGAPREVLADITILGNGSSVIAAAATGSGSSGLLPRTGGGLSIPLALTGLLLVLLGSTAVRAARRRRHATA